MASKTRWKRGTFRVLLDTGQDFVFTGAVRFERTPDGFYGDYEIDCDEIELWPSFNRVVTILRVEIPAGPKGDE